MSHRVPYAQILSVSPCPRVLAVFSEVKVKYSTHWGLTSWSHLLLFLLVIVKVIGSSLICQLLPGKQGASM